MRNMFSKLALVVALGLALAFTFSCSGGDDNDNGGSSSSITGGLSSPSGNSSNSSVTGSECSSLPIGIKGKSGTFVDDRDNITYKWVEIGEQTWMAENLNYRGTEPDTLGKCYNNDLANCEIYGRLYNWVTAMGFPAGTDCGEHSCSGEKRQGICPDGWHIPYVSDWYALMEFVDPTYKYTSFTKPRCAGKKLKATSGWFFLDRPVNNSTDDYGFSALPGGHGGINPIEFGQVGDYGGWWDSYNSGNSAYVWSMYYNFDGVDFDLILHFKVSKLRSIRCVKDN